MRELQADLVIVGAGVGGCAAAWAALRRGRRVILSESCDWLGGQLTSQAVPPDEHPWIEQFGCTRSYRRLREGIREHYRHYYPLTEAARANRLLNPGNGFVSAICHEPRVSLAVLEGFLSPYRAGGQLTVLTEHEPVRVENEGDRVSAVHLQGPEGPVVCHAPYFIDATETGDLLPLGGVEYVTGAESVAETGEPHAKPAAQPANQQAISWCFILDYQPDRDNTIERPRDYAFWRDYLPPLTPSWGGPLLSWQATHPITLEPVVRSFDPLEPEPHRGPMDLWTFRRIADRANFQPGAYESDICLVNWPQIDYLPGNIVDVDAAERERHLEGARQLSTSMLYWMQTEAPRRDGGTGWKGLRLRGDLCGTSHGLAKRPYIRESRRIRGRFTVKEQHVGGEGSATVFPDSVGVGAYRIDLHPSTGGDNYIDVSAWPFQIPLGALLPRRVENLMAGGKNLACTHITNGCYRLHPVEWNVGEAAGLLAAFCLEHDRASHQVGDDPADFQALLRAEGVELEWPRLETL
ncbi:FAD-dependent oxidoreductase [bacterium CPR1]|nr:FAD-dependent oxidoreductase [bacterium CPR1]